MESSLVFGFGLWGFKFRLLEVLVKWNEKWSMSVNLLNSFIVVLKVISFFMLGELENLSEVMEMFGFGVIVLLEIEEEDDKLLKFF